MPTVYDVPANTLIKKITDNIKRISQVKPPLWAAFVKTGSHAERAPQDHDWWYTRTAALLRKIYVHGPIGLGDLESMYGGSKAVGYSFSHHRNGGGSNIRNIIHQLEAAGLVTKQDAKGRVLTSKGRSLLDRTSNEIFKEMIKDKPDLTRYS